MGKIYAVLSENKEFKEIDPRYDMSCNQALSIKELYGGTVEAIAYSFQYGYSQGMKAANSVGNDEEKECRYQNSMAETIIKKINAADDDKLRNLSLFIDVFLEDKKPDRSI